jgi:hypothetical protein
MLGTDQIAQIGLGVVVVLSVLAPAAALLAWMLRRGRMIGGPAAAGIVGGAIAGVLLGATVLGKAAPDAYTSIYVGGIGERVALIGAQRAVERELAALTASGVTPEAVREHRQSAEPKLAAYADRFAGAQRLRSQSIDAAGMLLGCAVLALGAGWAGRTRRRPMTGGAIAAGFGMVLGAGVPVFCCAAWLGGFSHSGAWALAASVGVGSAWPTAGARRFGAAGRSPETDAGALVALLIGLAAIVMAVLSVNGIRSFSGAWSVVFVIVAIGAGAWRVRARRPRSQRRALSLCHGVVTPTLTAVCVATIDWPGTLVTRACIVASVAALLFASDGRWFGAWLGWRIFGDADARESAWRRSAAALANNVGAVSIGVGALGRGGGLVDDAGMIAVLAGALLVESTSGLRRRFAGRLDETLSSSDGSSSDGSSSGSGAIGEDDDQAHDS